MGLLAAAVVLVGVIAVVDVLLWFGIVRRLREQTTRLEDLSTAGAGRFEVMLAPGETVPDFSTTMLDGREVTVADFDARTLVAFLSTTCSACVERMPEFLTYAAGHPGGRDRVLTIVISDEREDAEPMLAELAAVARAAHEVPEGPMATAFGVKGYPAFALIDPGGVVRTTGIRPDSLSTSARR